MNRNETISAIKESLKKLFSATEQKFSDFVLTDGSKITTTAETLDIGVEVYAVDDKGNQTPLNDGSYVLQDGRTIEVVGNKITEIAGPEEATEDETPVSDANVSMADGMAEQPSGEGDLAQRVADLESQLEEILNLLKSMTEAQTQTNEQMMKKVYITEEKLSKISNEPGENPIKTAKTGYNEYDSKKISFSKNMEEIEDLRKLISEKHKRDNNMAL